MISKLAILVASALFLSALSVVSPARTAPAGADLFCRPGTSCPKGRAVNCQLGGALWLMPWYVRPSDAPGVVRSQTSVVSRYPMMGSRPPTFSVSACSGSGSGYFVSPSPIYFEARLPQGTSCTSIASHDARFENPPIPTDPNKPFFSQTRVSVRLQWSIDGHRRTASALNLKNIVSAELADPPGFTLSGTVVGSPERQIFAGQTLRMTARYDAENEYDFIVCLLGSSNPRYAAKAAEIYASKYGSVEEARAAGLVRPMPALRLGRSLLPGDGFAIS